MGESTTSIRINRTDTVISAGKLLDWFRRLATIPAVVFTWTLAPNTVPIMEIHFTVNMTTYPTAQRIPHRRRNARATHQILVAGVFMKVVFTIGIAKTVAQDPVMRISIFTRERDVRVTRRTTATAAYAAKRAIVDPFALGMNTYATVTKLRRLGSRVGIVILFTQHAQLMSVVRAIVILQRKHVYPNPLAWKTTWTVLRMVTVAATHVVNLRTLVKTPTKEVALPKLAMVNALMGFATRLHL